MHLQVCIALRYNNPNKSKKSQKHPTVSAIFEGFHIFMIFMKFLLIRENIIANNWPDNKFFKMACKSIKDFLSPQRIQATIND